MSERFGSAAGLRIGHGSAGRWRKAGLVAALVGNLPVPLLDEPRAAIDTHAVSVVTAPLESLRATHTMLFTAHGDCPVEPDSSPTLALPVRCAARRPKR